MNEEVTPAMIEAGIRALAWYGDTSPQTILVVQIYEAMAEVRQEQKPVSERADRESQSDA